MQRSTHERKASNNTTIGFTIMRVGTQSEVNAEKIIIEENVIGHAEVLWVPCLPACYAFMGLAIFESTDFIIRQEVKRLLLECKL